MINNDNNEYIYVQETNTHYTNNAKNKRLIKKIGLNNFAKLKLLESRPKPINYNWDHDHRLFLIHELKAMNMLRDYFTGVKK